MQSPPPNPAQRTVNGMHWARTIEQGAKPQITAQSAAPQSSDGPIPNDLQVDQWDLHNTQGSADMHILDAWKITKGDNGPNGPVIAFVDTGLDLQHPDIAANLWTNPGEIPGNGIDDDNNGVIDDVHGYDAFFDKCLTQDEKSDTPHTGPGDNVEHGTHTAGTAAAVGDNGIGMTGVMQKAKLMPVKMFVAGWMATTEATQRALDYTKKMGADIVNHSWGNEPFTPSTYEAFCSFPSALHVLAAGNNGQDNDKKDYFPGNFELDNLLVVAASDRNDQRLGISSYGATNVDVTAPGEDIYSTIPGGYAKKSATSFATPHVTGLAGLIASAYPELTPLQIKERIIYSSDRIPALRDVSLSGGRINAAAALENDTVAPGAPTNFQLTDVQANRIKLEWLTPADDGQNGQSGSARVEVRVSDQPITPENYNQALPYLTPDPTSVGQLDSVDLLGETQGKQLFFAARAIDNVGNRSPMVTAQFPRS
jgi:serine protease